MLLWKYGQHSKDVGNTGNANKRIRTAVSERLIYRSSSASKPNLHSAYANFEREICYYFQIEPEEGK